MSGGTAHDQGVLEEFCPGHTLPKAGSPTGEYASRMSKYMKSYVIARTAALISRHPLQ